MGAVLVVLAAIFAGASWLWLERALSPVAETTDGARTIAFQVEPGDSFGRVAATLEDEGMIRSAKVARWFAESENLASKLKIGEYELSDAQ